MKFLILLGALALTTLMGCDSLFGNNDSRENGNAFGKNTIITQAVIDDVTSPDYVYNTNQDGMEILSVHSVFENFYLHHEEELGKATSYKSILGILQDIEDPYSDYYDPIQANILIEDFNTPDVQGLIGIQFSSDDTLKILRVYPNSPASRAGLKAGDQIIKANGEFVVGTDDNLKAYQELTDGGVGTNVSLRILRGNAFFNFTMVKEEVAIPTVWVDSLSDGASLIQITVFEGQTLEEIDSDTSGTWAEFRAALEETKDEKVSVIDLRNNPGGFVNICTGMADEIVGNDIFFIGREISEGVFSDDTVRGTEGGMAEDRQFILLANEGSASCSELFIEALTKNTNSQLIGTQTYGKGIAQGFFGTYRDGIVKTTSLQYYDVNDNSYHGVGHTPDFLISDPDAQLEKAIELANEINGVKSLNKISSKPKAQLQKLLDSRRSNKQPEMFILPTKVLPR